MRKLWGPLGWLTLHSISALYPDQPTDSDKAKLKDFMSLFASTIVCPHCNRHFNEMFGIYTKKYPNWADSKLDLFVFICRAHNTVNRRLDKPVIKTIQDCIETLRNNTISTSSKEFRVKYINYITRSWTRDRNDSTIVQLPRCSKLARINEEYWNTLPQEVKFEFLPDIDVTEHIGKTAPGPYVNKYATSNLTLLKKGQPKEGDQVQQVTTYTVTETPNPLVLTKKPSGFIRVNGKLKLIGT